MTRMDHESGSDRIFEALVALDPDRKVETVVNVQGDLPTIDPETIRSALAPFENADVDIATLGVEILRDEEKVNPNVVKIVGSPIAANRLRALYFTRATAPWGEGPLYHHIGLYAYRRAALERFVSLPPSSLERRERLEQLRAVEAGMRIDVEIVQTVPLGVDTPDDLERAREILESSGLPDHARKNQQHLLPGRTWREFRHRLPQRLSVDGAAALRDVRGRVQRGRERQGRSRHDPDREHDRRARRRHPSSAAGIEAAHRRRVFPADPLPADGAAGHEDRGDQSGPQPHPRARPVPQSHPPAPLEAGGGR